MSDPEKPENMPERMDKYQQLTSQEQQTMRDICVHVANGGSLIDLCKLWAVGFGEMHQWIVSDRKREKEYIKAIKARQEWVREAVLREIRKLSFSDISKILNPSGGILPIEDWPDGVSDCVASFEVEEIWWGKGKDREQVGELKKVKLWSKEKALQMLGKNAHLFVDTVHLETSMTLEQIVAGSRDVTDEG